MFGRSSSNGTKDIDSTIQNSAHRSVNHWLAGQLFPRELHFLAALAVMEWTGVIELRRPIRAFKVEGLRSLSNPRAFGKSRREVGPIYFKSGAFRVCSNLAVSCCQPFSNLRDSFPVSCQSLRSCFMRPTLIDRRCIARVVEVQRDRNM